MESNIIYQCALCGWFDDKATQIPRNCPDCGCQMIREATKETLDRVNPEAVAHLKKQVKKCWNYDVNPISGAQSYHDLKLVWETDTNQTSPDADPDKALIVRRHRCETCKQVYSQQIIPVTRLDVFERLGILNEVRDKLPEPVQEKLSKRKLAAVA